MKVVIFIIIITILYIPNLHANDVDNIPEDFKHLIKDTKLDQKNLKKDIQLLGLNKITATTSILENQVGQIINFGNLEITIHKCWKSPPEEEPENKAVIEIWEKIPGEENKKLFLGWMFSSSPAISTLEHPVYDISLINCLEKDN